MSGSPKWSKITKGPKIFHVSPMIASKRCYMQCIQLCNIPSCPGHWCSFISSCLTSFQHSFLHLVPFPVCFPWLYFSSNHLFYFFVLTWNQDIFVGLNTTVQYIWTAAKNCRIRNAQTAVSQSAIVMMLTHRLSLCAIC